ncbi:hypothetical protein J6590_038292 [Homalodisca vitripennis]|nr:hypothetical protein J6590_038292 [Homalodisca vitripennis]
MEDLKRPNKANKLLRIDAGNRVSVLNRCNLQCTMHFYSGGVQEQPMREENKASQPITSRGHISRQQSRTATLFAPWCECQSAVPGLSESDVVFRSAASRRTRYCLECENLFMLVGVGLNTFLTRWIIVVELNAQQAGNFEISDACMLNVIKGENQTQTRGK